MASKTLGEAISTLRKEKGMTQKELADKLGITDKAVSKWERNIACPDIQIIPELAEILGVSVDELLNAKTLSAKPSKSVKRVIDTALRAVGIAMGVAVAVLSLFSDLDRSSGFAMLGVGLACISVYLMRDK